MLKTAPGKSYNCILANMSASCKITTHTVTGPPKKGLNIGVVVTGAFQETLKLISHTHSYTPAGAM